jgi:hypothetical protein
MSDQAPEARARELGWVPKEEFRGDHEKWVDAETFNRRGEEIMPILKKNNKELMETVNRLRDENARMKGDHESLLASVEELKTFQREDTRRQVKEGKAKLLAELRTAKEAGDTDREIELTDQLTEVNGKIREAEAAPEQTPADRAKAALKDPAFLEWKAENPWVDVDRVRTATAVAIAADLRDKGNRAVGKDFFAAVSKELAKVYPELKRTTKVESSGGGEGGGSSEGAKRTYADLPTDAKETCERQSSKMAGQGKAFKSKSEWQAYYVEQYYAGEEA